MTTEIIPLARQQLNQAITDVAGQIAKSSQRTYENATRLFAFWLHEQGLTPETMTRSDMIAYRSYLNSANSEKTGKPYSKASKQNLFSIACRLMREQYANGRAANVTHEIKGFKGSSGDETTHTALTIPECKALLACINTNTSAGKRDYALLYLLLKTGMRRAEAVALNRGDLTVRDGHHVAIVRHGKGDKLRVVKIRVDVFREITTYLDCLPAAGPDTPLFVSNRRGDHLTSSRLTDKGVEVILKKYADLTPHDLRATFITLALEAEATLEQTQYAAGHSDPRTTQRYRKRKLNLDNNAVDKLNF